MLFEPGWREGGEGFGGGCSFWWLLNGNAPAGTIFRW